MKPFLSFIFFFINKIVRNMTKLKIIQIPFSISNEFDLFNLCPSADHDWSKDSANFWTTTFKIYFILKKFITPIWFWFTSLAWFCPINFYSRSYDIKLWYFFYNYFITMCFSSRIQHLIFSNCFPRLFYKIRTFIQKREMLK